MNWAAEEWEGEGVGGREEEGWKKGGRKESILSEDGNILSKNFH